MSNSHLKESTTRNYLLSVLSKNDDKQEIAEIFDILMTDKEQQELINRLNIFALLQQGATQREISAELGVGIATVSRGAKICQQHDIKKVFPEIEKINHKSA